MHVRILHEGKEKRPDQGGSAAEFQRAMKNQWATLYYPKGGLPRAYKQKCLL